MSNADQGKDSSPKDSAQASSHEKDAGTPAKPADPLAAEPNLGDQAPAPESKPKARKAHPTLMGMGPAPIIPRRRTPPTGIGAQPVARILAPNSDPPSKPRSEPRPAAGIADARLPESVRYPNIPSPVIRVQSGGVFTAPTSPSVAVAKAGSLLCEILVRHGAIAQKTVDEAIALQEERGGQIGRILISMGACSEDAIARALVDQLRDRTNRGNPNKDASTEARAHKDVAGLRVLTRPGLTIATLMASDFAALLLAALIASAFHWFRTYSELGQIDFSSWLVVGPSIALCMLTFFGLELYQPMAKSTPDEIRDVAFSASLVHLGATLLSSLGNLPIVKWGVFVRVVWWFGSMCFVPVFRSFVRDKLSVQPWWGIPVCVLGASKTGRLIVRTLKAQPRSGLKPVMLLDDDPAKHGTLRASFTNEKMDVYSINISAASFLSEQQRAALTEDLFGAQQSEIFGSKLEVTSPVTSDHIPPSSWDAGEPHVPAGAAAARGSESPPPSTQRFKSQAAAKDSSVYPRGRFAEVEGVPVVGDLSLAPVLAQRLKIPYAVVAMPGVDSAKLVQIVETIGGNFSHLLIIPDLFGFATLGVPAKNLGGILGVEVKQQLLLPGPRLAKRIMDIALTCVGGLLVAPFLLLVAALIKIDSEGPVLYTQKRLGRDGEHFTAYKFRTMHGDGEARLAAILEADPALRAEYEIFHKLRKDPRVTRIGRILRKFSLDEFPQLLNVLLGDMSLVGPRPYIERELTEMKGQQKIILRAPPGMTGMWQVSDRNATSFAQRVLIDVYYVRNWSPWLDIHIVAKTFGVVLRGSGV